MRNVLALIIANPGDLQNGLLALLTTMPEIQTVLVAEEADSALRIVTAHRPALVLLDMSLPKQDIVLRQIKTEWPKTLCIALIGTVQHAQGATVAMADARLLKGFSPSKFIDTVETLLNRPPHSATNSS